MAAVTFVAALSLWPPVGPRRRLVTVRVRGLALEPTGLVDDALEQASQRVLAQRPLDGHAVLPNVAQYLRLAIRLINLEPERLLDLAYLQRARRALVEQLHQPLVELVDPLPQLVDGHAGTSPVSHRM